MTTNLPDALIGAIAETIQPFSLGDLRKHAQSLSTGYRTRDDIRHTLSPIESAAYLCVRFPSTYAVAAAVWQEILGRIDGSEIRTILDAGAGPGTASLAAFEQIPEARLHLLERDSGWRPIAEACARAVGAHLRFSAGSIEHAGPDIHDAVVASYALNELPRMVLEKTVVDLWRCTAKVLVIIEPGTPLGFDIIRRIRAILIEAGAYTIAPCPHDLTCPMTGTDWCHRPVRVLRSEIHRRVKDADLAYEDEKFSYVAVSRNVLPAMSAARIVRKPMLAKGHLHLDVCQNGGIRRLTYSKKNRAAYKSARDSAWGDLWEPDQSPRPLS
ncbi:MAG: small ribosomal subunit Rsm22 family protein [Micropepsaceae bacterium]